MAQCLSSTWSVCRVPGLCPGSGGLVGKAVSEEATNN